MKLEREKSLTPDEQPCQAVAIAEEEILRFGEDGFLIVENLIDAKTVGRLRSRFGPLFAGEFETGVYPDEWYWREGMSLPDVTRHMANAWKSDLAIAEVVLSPEIGRIAATLGRWTGARLGQDTIWWKTSGAKEIALHQDGTYISFLDPPEMITFWITLDDTSSEAGTLEYVRGSHEWPLVKNPGDFHAPESGYRSAMLRAAAVVGVSQPDIVKIEVPAGGCAIHHGMMWHGSGPNTRSDLVRRSIGVHMLCAETKFRPQGAGYIYGRYQRWGETNMDESFFPILWTKEGYRSSFLEEYLCRNKAVWLMPSKK